eukprot:PhF_6_TR21704/c0_g1_i1/m.30999
MLQLFLFFYLASLCLGDPSPATTSRDVGLALIQSNFTDSSQAISVTTQTKIHTLLSTSGSHDCRVVVAVVNKMNVSEYSDIPRETVVSKYCMSVVDFLSSDVVLLFLSIGDRKVRIETSPSCRRLYTDSACGAVIGLMRPVLGERQYNEAVILGTTFLTQNIPLGMALPFPNAESTSGWGKTLALAGWVSGALILASVLYKKSVHLASVSIFLGLLSAPFFGLSEICISTTIVLTYAAWWKYNQDQRELKFLNALSTLRRLKFDKYPNAATSTHCALCMGVIVPKYSMAAYPCGHYVHYDCSITWQHKYQRCVCPVCELPIPQAPTVVLASSETSNSIPLRNAASVLDAVKVMYSEECEPYSIDAVVTDDFFDLSWTKKSSVGGNAT